jgi:microcystin-dependent protein
MIINTDLIYPIGSIYLSVNATNPSKYFGGTWEQISQGRTLVGVNTSDTSFNTVEKTGGEKNHTLTIDEMPIHNHGGRGFRLNARSSSGSQVVSSEIINSDPINEATSVNAGGGQSHNNLQPYITVYFWKRIS